MAIGAAVSRSNAVDDDEPALAEPGSVASLGAGVPEELDYQSPADFLRNNANGSKKSSFLPQAVRHGSAYDKYALKRENSGAGEEEAQQQKREEKGEEASQQNGFYDPKPKPKPKHKNEAGRGFFSHLHPAFYAVALLLFIYVFQQKFLSRSSDSFLRALESSRADGAGSVDHATVAEAVLRLRRLIDAGDHQALLLEMESIVTSQNEEEDLARVQGRLAELREQLSSATLSTSSSSVEVNGMQQSPEKLPSAGEIASSPTEPESVVAAAQAALQVWKARASTAEQLQRELVQHEKQQSEAERSIGLMRAKAAHFYHTKEQLDRHKKSLAALLRELQALQADVTQFSAKQDGVRAELEAVRERRQPLQERLEQAEFQRDEQRKRVRQAEELHEQQQRQLLELKAKWTASNEAVRNHIARVSGAGDRIERISDESSTKERQMHERQTERDQLVVKLTVHEQLADAISSLSDDLEQLLQAGAGLGSLSDAVEAETRAIDAKQAELDALPAAAATAAAAAAAVTSAGSGAGTSASSLSGTNLMRHLLRGQLMQMRKRLETLLLLRDELGIESLNERADVDSVIELHAGRARREVAAVRKQIDSIDSQLSRLTARLSELARDKAAVQDLMATAALRRASLEVAAERQHNDVESAKRETAASRGQLESFKAGLQQHDDAVRALVENVAKEARALEVLEAALLELGDQQQRRRVELQKEATNGAAAFERLVRLRHQLVTALESLDAIDAALVKRVTTLRDGERDIERLALRLSAPVLLAR